MKAKQDSFVESETLTTKSESVRENAGGLKATAADKSVDRVDYRAEKIQKKQATKSEKQASRSEKQATKTERHGAQIQRQAAKTEKKESGWAEKLARSTETRQMGKAERRKVERQKVKQATVAVDGPGPETPTLTYKDVQSIPQNCHHDPIFAVRNPDSDQLLLVFTGYGGSVGVTLDELYRNLPDPKPNVLFISPSRTGKVMAPFLDGIQALGADRASTIAAINRLGAEWGVAQINTLGVSVGSFGAILFGIALRTKTIVAFGPMTSFKAGFDERVDRYRAEGGFEATDYPEDEVDLNLYYRKHNQGTKIKIYYSHENPRDRHQAENFAGTEGVTLVPVQEQRHSVLKVLAANGALRTELRSIFSSGKQVLASVFAGALFFFLEQIELAQAWWLADLVDLAA